MTVWLLALLLTSVASDGSSGSYPLTMKLITGSNHVLGLGVVDATFTAVFPVMLGRSRVSWMKECVTPLG
ncbi:hypothetical protein A2U01_0066639, partial [Trifolium medium]|nr:hypothetical protein [Trifolium medium]